MTISKSISRQYPLVAMVSLTYADYTSGSAAEMFDLPADARVIGGVLKVDTAWNSATSSSGDVGDGSDPNRYTASPVNMKTAAATALTITGYKYTDADSVDITITDVGAPTAGAATVMLWYVIDDRAHENESRT